MIQDEKQKYSHKESSAPLEELNLDYPKSHLINPFEPEDTRKTSMSDNDLEEMIDKIGKASHRQNTELKTYEKYKKRAEIARGGKIELPPHLQEDDPENYKDYREILQAILQVNNITKHTQHQLVESTPVSRGISKHRDHQSHYSTIKIPSNPSKDKLRRNHKEGDETPECINDNKNHRKTKV